MSVTLKALVGFLVILNPFALCLYLQEIMNVLGRKDFVLVLLRACVISLLVFWGFALSGERLLVDVLAIKPGAMRAFGWLIFLIIGYNYVAKGYKVAETLRGSMDELPLGHFAALYDRRRDNYTVYSRGGKHSHQDWQ